MHFINHRFAQGNCNVISDFIIFLNACYLKFITQINYHYCHTYSVSNTISVYSYHIFHWASTSIELPFFQHVHNNELHMLATPRMYIATAVAMNGQSLYKVWSSMANGSTLSTLKTSSDTRATRLFIAVHIWEVYSKALAKISYKTLTFPIVIF